jgi:hypothetical protein
MSDLASARAPANVLGYDVEASIRALIQQWHGRAAAVRGASRERAEFWEAAAHDLQREIEASRPNAVVDDVLLRLTGHRPRPSLGQSTLRPE